MKTEHRIGMLFPEFRQSRSLARSRWSEKNCLSPRDAVTLRLERVGLASSLRLCVSSRVDLRSASPGSSPQTRPGCRRGERQPGPTGYRQALFLKDPEVMLRTNRSFRLTCSPAQATVTDVTESSKRKDTMTLASSVCVPSVEALDNECQVTE
jgi:hypothetical protein